VIGCGNATPCTTLDCAGAVGAVGEATLKAKSVTFVLAVALVKVTTPFDAVPELNPEQKNNIKIM